MQIAALLSNSLKYRPLHCCVLFFFFPPFGNMIFLIALMILVIEVEEGERSINTDGSPRCFCTHHFACCQ